VNAAFLLVTAAWFAGADAAPTKPPEQIKPPVTTAPGPGMPAPGPVVGGGCGSCGDCGCSDCCDECGGHGLKHKLKGLFRHHKGGDCCCEEASCCAPAPAPTCCAPAPTCGGCDTCCDTCEEGHGFLHKLKGRFHHHKAECCDTCDTCGPSCGGCGGCGAPIGAPGPAVMPKIEGSPKGKETPPKNMPSGDGTSVKPLDAQAAPRAVPNVTVETEKSPF
jgi:hypothetical protein